MILLVCVDDHNGTMFNSRRQSQDRILRQRIIELTKGKKLLMNSYSAKQFESQDGIVISDSFLSQATVDDYCFVEDADPTAVMANVDKIVLYKWNRSYPYDRTFDFDKESWSLTQSTDFAGHSHEKITEEVYDRK